MATYVVEMQDPNDPRVSLDPETVEADIYRADDGLINFELDGQLVMSVRKNLVVTIKRQ